MIGQWTPTAFAIMDAIGQSRKMRDSFALRENTICLVEITERALSGVTDNGTGYATRSRAKAEWARLHIREDNLDTAADFAAQAASWAVDAGLTV